MSARSLLLGAVDGLATGAVDGPVTGAVDGPATGAVDGPVTGQRLCRGARAQSILETDKWSDVLMKVLLSLVCQAWGFHVDWRNCWHRIAAVSR